LTTSARKLKEVAMVEAYFMPKTTYGVRNSLQSYWQNKKAVKWCDFTIDACIPFNIIKFFLLSACHRYYNGYGS
jgi:hypothetical protein